MNEIMIAPSILSADFSELGNEIRAVVEGGADLIHIDVMDGHFVPNITFGPVMVSTLKRITKLPLDVHLMISEPDKYIKEFADAGADIITVHQETCNHLHRTIQLIKDCAAKAGVSLNPATGVDTLKVVATDLDLILLMSVNPGFGGQKFIESTLKKIEGLAKLKIDKNYAFEIEVDGGINPETAKQVVKAGAEVLVAGNAIFKQVNIGQACKDIKNAALSVVDAK
jgi:ribulose-phosphate 3-epimerase